MPAGRIWDHNVARDFDVIIVGSGINSLVCGALLGKRGKRVCVLERNPVLGGCIRTEELTAPGFLHDTLSTLYSLFVTAPHFPLLKDDLERFGVTFLNRDTPTAVVLPDERSLIFTTSRAANMAALDVPHPGDGAAYGRAMSFVEQTAGLTFPLLGQELWRAGTATLLARHALARNATGLASFFGLAMESCRSWVEANFRSDLVRALLAPWVLHVGLGPESAMSAHMARLIMFTLEAAGGPMVKGGSARLVTAFAKLIGSCGGELRTNADVAQVLTRRGAATGVRLTDGREISSAHVVCNVTPTQLYGRLLAPDLVPPEVAEQAAAYKYGRGEMQIHLALSSPPEWANPALRNVAMLHLTPGLDGVSRAVNEAERGLLPAEATIVVAQPIAVDPSRAPAGKWILWIQLQELPRRLKGDALDEIPVADGEWTADIRERYADRIIDRLSRHIPNLKSSIVGRAVLSPADLQALNMNLVGGDPYSGSCTIDQFMMWRPLRATRNHATPVDGLFHIGASTHPGPGLGGMSGFMVANLLS